jgi:hypothetical protein
MGLVMVVFFVLLGLDVVVDGGDVVVFVDDDGG